jgi:hypothetical protein
VPDHLTRTRAGFVFQIRIPKALDPGLSYAPIRVTRGSLSATFLLVLGYRGGRTDGWMGWHHARLARADGPDQCGLVPFLAAGGDAMTRWTFPSHATRSVLLARCPRLVRLSLERHLPQQRLVNDTAQAIATLVPELAPAATAWATGWTPARTYVEPPFRSTTAALLEALEGFAAVEDSRAATELGDLVRASSYLTEDRVAAARLASSAWGVLHRVESLALSLRCLEPDEAEIRMADSASPFAEIDDFDLSELALPADKDAVRQAWWRDLSRAYDDLRQDTRAMCVGLSAFAVGLVLKAQEHVLLARAAVPAGQYLLRPVAQHAITKERTRVAAEREEAERQERRKAERSPQSL